MTPPGLGVGRVHRVESSTRIKVSEQRELPAAARRLLAAASGDVSHTRKAVRIRLPEKRAQVNNWWRLIRPGQSFAENQCIRFRAVLESSAKYRTRERSADFECGYDLPSRVWLRPFCLLATYPITPSPRPVPAFSFLLKVASLWLLLPYPPLQSRPLPCPVRWGQLMNISALPEERLAPLGTSRVRLLRAAAPDESPTAGSNRLWGPPSLHVIAIVWRNPVGVELGREGPKSCSAKKSHIILRS